MLGMRVPQKWKRKSSKGLEGPQASFCPDCHFLARNPLDPFIKHVT
jgi:hypothetical protein